MDARDAETPDAAPPDEDEDASSPRGYSCDLCGAAMIEVHCRIVCRNCGYQRDCSDP